MDAPSLNQHCDISLPYNSMCSHILEPQSLLEELLGDIDMPPPEQFERDLEQSFSDCAYGVPSLTFPDFDAYAFNSTDWVAALALSSPQPASPLSSSSSDSSHSIPLSPVSDATLMSDFSPSCPKEGWVLSDDPEDSSAFNASTAPGAHNGFEFTFERELQVSSCSGTPTSSRSYDDYAQQPLQHDSRVAAAEAHSLELGTLAEPIFPPLSFPTTQSSVRPLSPPLPAPIKRASSVEDVEKPGPKKRARRRRPDVRQYECSQCDQVFGRSHNLKVHITTVHEGKRMYACEVPGCGMALARKHDLERHIISKHTDRGSPRKLKATRK